MVKSILLPISLFMALTSSVAYTQTGPKDGMKLKPTEENLDGNGITLSDLREKKNVILVFYRGQW